MQLEKFKIKKNGIDINVPIKISTDIGFAGAEQEIDSLTTFTADEIINPVVDAEKRRFKLDIDTPVSYFQFYFYNALAIPQHNTYFPLAGYTQYEVSGLTQVFLNSFFILDFYDSYNPNTQTKIFTTYLTKLKGYSSTYNISANTNQFYYWYIPVSYMNIQTGTTVTGYTKFSFYNAKTGKLQPFYNVDNTTLTTPEKSYFKTELDIENRTWKIINPSYPYVIANEWESNALYKNRINDTFSSYSGITQIYPTGNTYFYETNSYSLT